MIDLIVEHTATFIIGVTLGGLGTFVPFVIWVAITRKE